MSVCLRGLKRGRWGEGGRTYGIGVDFSNDLETLEVVETTAADDSNLDGLENRNPARVAKC